ncbi:MAG: fumarate hydratase C-terminal domain-containing protein [Thermoleophilia bacterium]|nr:fumarate hydratase C-terminal domain-containing protein [Thermoleophilia bacterium]
MAITLTPPLSGHDVRELSVGDPVLITGVIYTARDAAHQRLIELIERGEDLPVDLAGQIIYYTGPTPAQPGMATGSAGPTTSSRMDRFTPPLLAATGVRAMIGKGERSEEVSRSLGEHDAVYLVAVGGAGALLAEKIEAAEPAAWPELGTEAIFRLEVREFPAIVAIDTRGGNLYSAGRARYRRSASRKSC